MMSAAGRECEVQKSLMFNNFDERHEARSTAQFSLNYTAVPTLKEHHSPHPETTIR